MWIRSQDRKSLYEIKNRICIFHDDEDTDTSFEISLGDSSLTILGEYDTEERAIEVIDEIVFEMINIKHDNFSTENIVYQMPFRR